MNQSTSLSAALIRTVIEALDNSGCLKVTAEKAINVVMTDDEIRAVSTENGTAAPKKKPAAKSTTKSASSNKNERPCESEFTSGAKAGQPCDRPANDAYTIVDSNGVTHYFCGTHGKGAAKKFGTDASAATTSTKKKTEAKQPFDHLKLPPAAEFNGKVVKAGISKTKIGPFDGLVFQVREKNDVTEPQEFLGRIDDDNDPIEVTQDMIDSVKKMYPDVVENRSSEYWKSSEELQKKIDKPAATSSAAKERLAAFRRKRTEPVDSDEDQDKPEVNNRRAPKAEDDDE